MKTARWQRFCLRQSLSYYNSYYTEVIHFNAECG
jgi:hypothetical protein